MAFEVESRSSNESAVRAANVLAQSGGVVGIAPAISQSASWIGFGLSSAIARSIVHFFPSAGSVTAPYAANCKLAVFGAGLEQRSVNLEGARVSQPDGVRLDDVFPGLRETSAAVFGIEVEVSTMQQRVDLSSSGCVVELVYGAQSVRFFPHANDLERVNNSNNLLIQDGLINSSVIVVNRGAITANIDLRLTMTEAGSNSTIFSGTVNSGGVQEIPINADGSSKLTQLECSWGTMRAAPFTLSASGVEKTAIFAYLMYRDTVTRQPVSVTRISCS